jgi:hypothetical protein
MASSTVRGHPCAALSATKNCRSRPRRREVRRVHVGHLGRAERGQRDARQQHAERIDLELAQIDQGQPAQLARPGLADLNGLDGLFAALDRGVERDGAELGVSVIGVSCQARRGRSEQAERAALLGHEVDAIDDLDHVEGRSRFPCGRSR